MDVTHGLDGDGAEVLWGSADIVWWLTCQRGGAQVCLQGGIAQFRYPIVMDAANRNLMQIYLQERPDINLVRTIMQQVFRAVTHLHSKELIHGDLKLLNVVRFSMDGKLRIIDLDAAAKIGEEPACSKFSSGVLPPEALCLLKGDDDRAKFDEYWASTRVELRPLGQGASQGFPRKAVRREEFPS